MRSKGTTRARWFTWTRFQNATSQQTTETTKRLSACSTSCWWSRRTTTKRKSYCLAYKTPLPTESSTFSFISCEESCSTNKVASRWLCNLWLERLLCSPALSLSTSSGKASKAWKSMTRLKSAFINRSRAMTMQRRGSILKTFIRNNTEPSLLICAWKILIAFDLFFFLRYN